MGDWIEVFVPILTIVVTVTVLWWVSRRTGIPLIDLLFDEDPKEPTND